MLSRIADSFFWIARYIERADGILRMLKVNYATSLDQSTSSFSWKPTLKTFTSLTDQQIETMGKNSQDVLYFMIDDRKNENSIINLITNARENARGIQDILTLEVWEAINEFYHCVNSRKDKVIDDPLFSITDMINFAINVHGSLEITMIRGEGWLYMKMGRYLERSIQTADILESKFSELSMEKKKHVAIAYWRQLLLSISAYEIYLKTYRTGAESQNIVDLMLHNTDYPRSISYSLTHVTKTFTKLRDALGRDAFKKLEYKIEKVRSKVIFSDVDTILSGIGLTNFLRDVKRELYIICDDLQSLNYSDY